MLKYIMQIGIKYFVKTVIFNCIIFVPFVLNYIYICIYLCSFTFIYAFLHLFISVFLCPYFW